MALGCRAEAIRGSLGLGDPPALQTERPPPTSAPSRTITGMSGRGEGAGAAGVWHSRDPLGATSRRLFVTAGTEAADGLPRRGARMSTVAPDRDRPASCDESGHPIEGATVDVHAPRPGSTKGETTSSALGSAVTDAQGRWRLDVAPEGSRGSLGLGDPPALLQTERRPLCVAAARHRDCPQEGADGRRERCRCGEARPIRRSPGPHRPWQPGCSSCPPRPRTSRGQFTLEKCDPGPGVPHRPGRGLRALGSKRSASRKRTAPVEFRLTEPGSLLRVRVVDVRGKPRRRGGVSPPTPGTRTSGRSSSRPLPTGRGGSNGRAAAQGRRALQPLQGRLSLRDRSISLTATDREADRDPATQAGDRRGRVTDAETGRPVPKFRVVQGIKHGWRDAIDWSEGSSLEETSGRYTVTFDEAGEGAFIREDRALLGLQASRESRAFRPDEGSQTFDVALERAAGFSGVVLLPDGKPEEGAEVAQLGHFGRIDRAIGSRSGRFDRDADFPKTATGPDGPVRVPSAGWQVPPDRRERCRLCRRFLRRARKIEQTRAAGLGNDRGRSVDRPSGTGSDPGGYASTPTGPSSKGRAQHLRFMNTRRGPTSEAASDSTACSPGPGPSCGLVGATGVPRGAFRHSCLAGRKPVDVSSQARRPR